MTALTFLRKCLAPILTLFGLLLGSMANGQTPSASVWGVNASNDIFRWTGSGWQNIPGKLSHVSVGADGSVWGVNASSVIFRQVNGQWQPVTGALKQLSVGNAQNVWGVNAAQDIFRWDGAKWIHIPGKLTHVSVGTDGTVWGVNAAGNIFRMVNNQWQGVTGTLVQVSVGTPQNIWGVNAVQDIFRWDGAKWIHIPGKLVHVAVANNGTVWGVNAAGVIFQRAGEQWQPIQGALIQISTADAPSNSGQLVISMPNTLTATPAPGTSGTVLTGNATLTMVNGQPASSGSASTPSPSPRTSSTIFPRGQTWEDRILRALNFQYSANVINLGGQVGTRYDQLTPLEQGFGALALGAAEAHFDADRTITADQVIAKIAADLKTRQVVTTFTGVQLAALVANDRGNTPQIIALRQWATEVYRSMKILTAKKALEEYARWKQNPCAYTNNLVGPECQQNSMSSVVALPKPPEDLLLKNAMGGALGGYANEVASATAVGLGALAIGTAGAVLTSSLGAVTWASAGVSGVSYASLTSLTAAFGGSGGTAGAAGGAIGVAGWAGVVAAPVAAAVVAVVVGVTEGLAVAEANRVEPRMKLNLGAAMTETIVIQNVLQVAAAREFFLLAYQAAAAKRFMVEPSTVNGEVRFYCQAGYVCRFGLSFNNNGTPQNYLTKDLNAGFEESFVLPYQATQIVARGEYQAAGWKPLFTQVIPRPTYTGFTAFGTVFNPQVKQEYPELANIAAPANQLILTHQGGYLARVNVSYQQAGQQVVPLSQDNVALGWHSEITIPSNATNIRLIAQAATGLVWEPWKTIVDKSYPSPPNECIKFIGTTLAPTTNNDCR